jgi:hypothetical protein
MASDLQQLNKQVADLKRRMGGNQINGTVHEVKGDKIRINWGNGPTGQPVLSPWIDTSDHRGGSRERKFYKKGQNVGIATINGHMDENSTISADSPNQKFKAPDHADDAGEESETYQLGEMHKTNSKDTYDYFLAEEQQQDQQGGQQGGGGMGGGGQGGGAGGGQQQQKQKPKAQMKQRMNKKGGLTGRVGDGDGAARYAACEKGAKIRKGSNCFWVDAGGVWCSKPPQIKADGLPNDND